MKIDNVIGSKIVNMYYLLAMFKKLFSNPKPNYVEFQRKTIYMAKIIIEKPRWVILFFLGRFKFIRFLYSSLSQHYYKPQKSSNPSSCPLFTNLDTRELVKNLNDDGIALGISLPQEILKDLLHYVNCHDCYAGGQTHLGINIKDKAKVEQIYNQPFFTLRYFNVSNSCPSVLRLANDPKIQEIATGYIGRQAKYTGASLYWTFPTKDTPYDWQNQIFTKFHYDIDDYASLRFCFYLNDVTSESGPHVCIRGSHKKKSLLHVINYFSRIQSEKELIKFYGQEKFLTLTGKSGFGFIEDTFCFHKGNIPESQPRLLLQLHFAANNYTGGEYHDSINPRTLTKLDHINKANLLVT